MSDNNLDVNFIYGDSEAFPERKDGQILYDPIKNELYIDTSDGYGRSLINNYPKINGNSIDNLDWEDAVDTLPTSLVVKNAIDDANLWKKQGNSNDFLKKNDDGELSWVDLHNTIYWTDLTGEYGVIWDYSQPSSKLTRTGDASDYEDPVPAKDYISLGSSPFDAIYPWNEMKEVNILSDGTIIQKDDPLFSYTDNDVMVYIPEFYYKVEKDEVNKTHSWSIRGDQSEGYKKHLGSGRYIGKYYTSGGSSGVFSKSGVVNSPLTKTTRANFRTYSHNKGENWYMIDIVTWSALQMLYLVEYADFNSQSVLGMAQSKMSQGFSDNIAYHTYGSYSCNQYRYVEQMYGNVLTLIDGFIASDKAVYIGTNLSTSYTDDISSLTSTGITLPSKSNGFITEFAYNNEFDYIFIPLKNDGDSSNKYVCDEVYTGSGIRELAVGGRNTYSTSYGVFYFGANPLVTLNDRNYGSRLIYIPPSA